MSLDFPLILVILVFGTGLIWLADRLLWAPGRQRSLDALCAQYPQWSQDGSTDAKRFSVAAKTLPRESTIVEYSRSFFPVLAVVFVLRSFLAEPFQIPSSSMVPTLEVGDYILVNKFVYGIRLPVLRTKVLAISEPKRGDVMVFFPPHLNKTYYIKRVIGLPGDVVSYRSKRLYVNGEPIPFEPLAVVPEGRSRYQMGLAELGGKSHLQQINLMRPGRDFTVTVKPGHYFMMGDNRDNSSDSRVWGQVSERDIVGKAFAIWMHWDSLFSIPSFDRVGGIE
ncbi:signal peptidase I [Congregibacter variabilis]|uniref:Signal peptidase I n=1 Tax=Congregibacter variabilis TaxID=3081200 RepID=A0ABZ0I4E4_9GAMM|nr:signal peptidase I [Congregibacter sp. IMCC43200]